MFIIIVEPGHEDSLGRPSGLLFSFVSALLSILIALFLPSSVALSYFILVGPICECSGKHSCMQGFLISYSHAEWCLFSSDSATASARHVFGSEKYKYLCTGKPMLLNQTYCREVCWWRDTMKTSSFNAV